MGSPAGIKIEIVLDQILDASSNTYKQLKYNKPVAATYVPGDTVSGHVLVTRTDPQTTVIASNVLLSFSGRADVHIVTKKTDFLSNDNPLGIDATYEGYTKTFIFFEENRIPLARGVKLPVGVSEFSFMFQLPSDEIAPSFSGEYGDIFYGMEARLETFGYSDLTAVIAFNVLGHLLLSSIPLTESKVVVDAEEAVSCCLCWGLGRLTVRCTLSKRGYLPEEPVELLLTISNKTKRKVKQVIGHLVQVIEYIVGQVEEIENRTIVSKPLPGCKMNHTETWKYDLFQIPTGLQPTVPHGIIRIGYHIKVVFDVATASNFVVDCPIILGSHR